MIYLVVKSLEESLTNAPTIIDDLWYYLRKVDRYFIVVCGGEFCNGGKSSRIFLLYQFSFFQISHSCYLRFNGGSKTTVKKNGGKTRILCCDVQRLEMLNR